MAAKGSNKGAYGGGSGSGGRIKFRFVDIEMDNVNEATAEGLKSLVTALSARPMQTTAIRNAPKMLLVPEQNEGSEAEDEGGDPTAEEAVELGSEEKDPGRSEPKNPGKPRKLREPKFLRDLDLTQATRPLEDYISEKSPITINDKYLVIAQWFKEFLDIAEITVDHIYTAFDILKMRDKVPQDAGQPLRSLKGANQIDNAGRGLYKINWSGTKTVAAMKSDE